MNAKSGIALVACLALFVSACDSRPQSLILGDPQSLILGKWEVAGAQVGGVDDKSAAAAGRAIKMSAEFNRDGTAMITMMGQTLHGTYKIDGGNELEWTMSGITTKSKLYVTATELELTDDANRTIKYKRKSICATLSCTTTITRYVTLSVAILAPTFAPISLCQFYQQRVWIDRHTLPPTFFQAQLEDGEMQVWSVRRSIAAGTDISDHFSLLHVHPLP